MAYQKKATTTSAAKTKAEDSKVEKDTVEETDDLFLKVKEQYTKLVEVVRKMAMEG